jgi:hypothetical protein
MRHTVLSQISTLGSKIRKLALGNSMTYRRQNARNSNFATEPVKVVISTFRTLPKIPYSIFYVLF